MCGRGDDARARKSAAEQARLTLVLTRERLLLSTRWRRSVDVRRDDPAWPRVETSVHEDGHLHLLVPRGVGGGGQVRFEMDVRLLVADTAGWAREIETTI